MEFIRLRACAYKRKKIGSLLASKIDAFCAPVKIVQYGARGVEIVICFGLIHVFVVFSNEISLLKTRKNAVCCAWVPQQQLQTQERQ